MGGIEIFFELESQKIAQRSKCSLRESCNQKGSTFNAGFDIKFTPAESYSPAVKFHEITTEPVAFSLLGTEIDTSKGALMRGTMGTPEFTDLWHEIADVPELRPAGHTEQFLVLPE